MSPARGQAADFHQYQRQHFALPAYRHHNTFHATAHIVIPQFAAASTAPFTFVPAAAAANDGFSGNGFTDQLVKPFVGHTGETGDCSSCRSGIVRTQQHAVVACH